MKSCPAARSGVSPAASAVQVPAAALSLPLGATDAVGVTVPGGGLVAAPVGAGAAAQDASASDAMAAATAASRVLIGWA